MFENNYPTYTAMYSVVILFILISLAVIDLTNFDLELNLIDFILIVHVLMLKSLDQNLKNQIPVYFLGEPSEKSPKTPKMGAKEEQKLTKNDQFMKWMTKFGLKRNSPCEGKLMYKYVHRKSIMKLLPLGGARL